MFVIQERVQHPSSVASVQQGFIVALVSPPRRNTISLVLQVTGASREPQHPKEPSRFAKVASIVHKGAPQLRHHTRDVLLEQPRTRGRSRSRIAQGTRAFLESVVSIRCTTQPLTNA